jgi:hypothetical protein
LRRCGWPSPANRHTDRKHGPADERRPDFGRAQRRLRRLRLPASSWQSSLSVAVLISARPSGSRPIRVSNDTKSRSRRRSRCADLSAAAARQDMTPVVTMRISRIAVRLGVGVAAEIARAGREGGAALGLRRACSRRPDPVLILMWRGIGERAAPARRRRVWITAT